MRRLSEGFGASGRRELPLDALSQRVEAMRVWWAAYVHDGVTFTPETVAIVTGQLAALRALAEDYEDVLSQVNALLIARRVSGLQERLSKRGSIDAALAEKGLSETVMPASALLTAEHFASGKVAVFTRPWRRRHPSRLRPSGYAGQAPSATDLSGEAPEGSVDG